ncbi:MAG: OmpA family protein, partial [Paracoccaceae bacterium]
LLRGEGMFDPGKIVILPRYVTALERVADALNDEPGDVLVEGHTDSSGLGPRLRAKFGDNVGLSEARALAVKSLMEPWLVAPERMTISGFGETRPIADNATAEGKARNRRVEVVLIRPDGEDALGSLTEGGVQ